MKNVTIYTLQAPTSADISSVIEEISTYKHKKLLIHIYAYMHNTVTVQSLKKELEKHIQGYELYLLKQEEKTGAKIVVYGYDGDDTEDIQATILAQLTKRSLEESKELKNCKSELIQRYFHDQLTNLPNIYKLRKDLESLEEVTLISVSIDDFKSINSFYGFFVGDYILEQIGSFLQTIHQYRLYKMPGGEYILMADGYKSYYELLEFIEQLYKDLLANCINYNGTHICIDYTVVACTAKNIEKLLSKLSIAFDHAKKHKLPFFIYEDRLEFLSDYRENILLSSKIREAIQNDQIIAYFQPIIENKTKKVHKFESLARLVDENKEVQSPDKFIEIAKKTKVYHLITRKMLQSSFMMFKDKPYEFSINISKDDIINEEIYRYIFELLQENKEMAGRVIFEFLESDAISEAERTIAFINEVKRYGAKIAIDDFGSGYSNFSLLVNMKIDFIKIDGDLIAQIDTNKSSYLVVEGIVEFAKKLGIAVIAEHVFSSSIFSIVKSMGIEYSQGFYIDKPRVDLFEKDL